MKGDSSLDELNRIPENITVIQPRRVIKDYAVGIYARVSTNRKEQMESLSHDGSDLHGYVMANSFAEFLEEYTKLGCIGGEDWQWEVFTNNHTTPIDSTCENAKKWLELMR